MNPMGSAGVARPIRLVYLAGTGRSGSTLLGRLLGEIDGWVYLGEALRYLFHDGMRERLPLCGCGEKVEQCTFWCEHEAAIDPALRSRATRALRLRKLVRPGALGRRSSTDDKAEDDGIGGAMASMLGRVQQTSGARVLVDGSKNPANGFALADREDVTLHVVHLVRHPGGVVRSWSKPKGYLRGHATWRILGWWWATNVFAELLGRRAASYHRVRYEDAVADPAAVLGRLMATVEGTDGQHGPPFPFLDGREATLGGQHMLAGNPDKLHRGKTVIRDRGWQLGPVRRVLVGAFTWPLLRRYGYGWRGVRRPGI